MGRAVVTCPHTRRPRPAHRRHVRGGWGFRTAGRAVVLAVAMIGPGAAARGHETDPFTAPKPEPGAPAPREFADLGPVLDRWMYRLVEAAVVRTNARIAACARANDDPARLAFLRRPDELVNNLDRVTPGSLQVIGQLERYARSPGLRDEHPGRVGAFRAGGAGVYGGAFAWPDVRAVSHLFLSSTVRVHGVHQGTDKLGHFTDMGRAYYWAYVTAARGGATEPEARRRAVAVGTDGVWSERGLLGLAGTGCYSNADLAANYAGMLFYLNLTEPVTVGGGRPLPPMVERDGLYWRLAAHVHPGAPLLAPFVTDHWDEALNPSLVDRGMRRNLRRAVRARAAGIIARYQAAAGRSLPAAYFAARRVELATYHGADYGHRGEPEELIDIASTCFDARSAGAAITGVAHAKPR